MSEIRKMCSRQLVLSQIDEASHARTTSEIILICCYEKSALKHAGHPGFPIGGRLAGCYFSAVHFVNGLEIGLEI